MDGSMRPGSTKSPVFATGSWFSDQTRAESPQKEVSSDGLNGGHCARMSNPGRLLMNKTPRLAQQ